MYVCMCVCMYVCNVWHNSCGDDFLFASCQEEASTLNDWVGLESKTEFMA
jgi:hypothetical protein